jgi:hypothetical protein
MPRLIDRVQIFPPNQIEVFYYETFEVGGQTIKSELLKFVTGLDYTTFLGLIQGELEADSPTPAPVNPDWASFTAQAFPSSSYQLFREISTNQKAWVVLENLTVSSAVSGNDLNPEGYLLLANQWDLLIAGLPTPPTTEQIEEMNVIAANTYMRFRFDENCLMVLA